MIFVLMWSVPTKPNTFVFLWQFPNYTLWIFYVTNKLPVANTLDYWKNISSAFVAVFIRR